MSDAPLVRVADLEFAYGGGDFALAVDSLEIAAGERVACIGPSGSGKTTLIHLICGIEVPARGSVRLAGVELARLPDSARRALRIRRVGLVFQRFELLDYLDALENVLLPYRVSPHLVLDAAARERARELAAATGIEHCLGRSPRRLSQGERQRVALCRALVTDPALVIADEPTGNLDPDTAARAMDLMLEQVSARGATLLVVTHDHGLLERFERVIDVRELVGRAAASGASAR